MKAVPWKNISDETRVSVHRASSVALSFLIFAIMLIVTGLFAKSDIDATRKIVEVLEVDSMTGGLSPGEMAALAGSSAPSKQSEEKMDRPTLAQPETKLMEIPEPVEQKPSVQQKPVSTAMEETISKGEQALPRPSEEYDQKQKQEFSPTTTASQPPSAPSQIASSPIDDEGQGAGLAAAGAGKGVLVNGALDAAGESLEDIGVMELTKIKLTYPPAAYHLNRDGYVEIEYSIGKDGVPKDIRIISSDPPGLFDKSAISSISRMKYSPKIIQGQAVEVVNVRKFLAYNKSRN